MSELLKSFVDQVNRIFVSNTEGTQKRQVNWSAVKAVCIGLVVVFVATVLLLPNESQVSFRETVEVQRLNDVDLSSEAHPRLRAATRSEDLWAAPKYNSTHGVGQDVNHNTSMIVGSGGQNSKTQVRAGQRLPLRILDRFIVSDQPVPVLADLLFAVETEAGLRLPAGTRFYGHATFQKGQERAQIRFTQISMPDGQIKQVQGLALGKDGQPGVAGNIRTDGAKNTAGQVLTTFIGGLAGGSIQTDVFGNSRGGIQNGLMAAVASTAKDRAQSYGEKLKTEREWIEVEAGTEFDGAFEQSLELQMGASNG